MDRTPMKKRKGLIAGLGAVAVMGLAAGVFFARGTEPKTTHGAHASHSSHGSSDEGDEEGEASEAGDSEGGQALAEGHSAKGHAKAHGEHSEHGDLGAAHVTDKGIIDTFKDAIESTQAKVEALSRVDLENERLKLENAHLRLKLESLQFARSENESSAKTQTVSAKLGETTGSRTGRDPQAVAYQIPTHLTPSQLYTLGVSYFKARETEKAAAILTFLTSLKDNDSYRTPKNYLLAGVAWYRLENYAKAEPYFDQILKLKPEPSVLGLQAHARLWKALASNRTGKHAKEQFWLTELLDHHPRSAEAGWVNRQGHVEAKRAIASEHH
jgi:hypothetical protein